MTRSVGIGGRDCGCATRRRRAGAEEYGVVYPVAVGVAEGEVGRVIVGLPVERGLEVGHGGAQIAADGYRRVARVVVLSNS